MNASTNTLRASPSRRLGLLLAALIAALLAAFALVLTVSQNTARAQDTKTVEVKANQGTWTDTGIFVPKGSRVGIKAEGKISLGAGYDDVTPDGIYINDPAVLDPNQLVAPELAPKSVGALVGRIGDVNTADTRFKVGDSRWIPSVPTAGELHLIVNDSYFANNSGSFFADVSVYYPDTTGPRVISTVPVARAKGVAPSANIKATFSENMKASTINDRTFMLFKNGSTTNLSATVSYNADTDKAKLNPTNNLRRGVTYKAVVTTGAEDLAGNQLDQRRGLSGLQPKVWHFKVSN